MWDIVLLAGLWFFTAGMSGILYWTKLWQPGGLWWFIFWNVVTLVVVAFEIVSKITTGRTMTQHIRKWAKEDPKRLWIGRAVVLSFSIGAACLVFHLFPF